MYIAVFFQSIEGDLLTVSLGAWMELPNLKMSEWKDVGEDYGKRINVSMVAAYYQDYIKKMALQKYFSDDTVVTSVRKVNDFSKLCDSSKCNQQQYSIKGSPVMENVTSTAEFHRDYIGGNESVFTDQGLLKHIDSPPNDEANAVFQHETMFMDEFSQSETNKYVPYNKYEKNDFVCPTVWNQ